jgi:hypothetical protein
MLDRLQYSFTTFLVALLASVLLFHLCPCGMKCQGPLDDFSNRYLTLLCFVRCSFIIGASGLSRLWSEMPDHLTVSAAAFLYINELPMLLF